MKDGTKLDYLVAHSNLFVPGLGNITPTIDLAGAVNRKLQGATLTVEGGFVVLTTAGPQGRRYPIPLSNIAFTREAKV